MSDSLGKRDCSRSVGCNISIVVVLFEPLSSYALLQRLTGGPTAANIPHIVVYLFADVFQKKFAKVPKIPAQEFLVSVKAEARRLGYA